MKKKTPQVGQLWRVATGQRKGGYRLVRITGFSRLGTQYPLAFVSHHGESCGHILLDYLMPASKEDILAYLKK